MKRFIKRLAVIAFVFGAILIWMGLQDYMDSKKTPVPYDTLTPEMIESGMIVEGDVPYNLGIFEEMYTTNYGIKTGDSSYIYLIPVGDQFMGLQCGNKETIAELDQQTEDTVKMFEGTLSRPSSIHFKGKTSKMDSEDLSYAKQALQQAGLTDSEIDDVICPMYITIVYLDGGLQMAGIGAVCILISLLLFGVQLKSYLSIRKRERTVFTENNTVSPLNYSGSPFSDNSFKGNPFENVSENQESENNYVQKESQTEDNQSPPNTQSSTGLKLKM